MAIIKSVRGNAFSTLLLALCMGLYSSSASALTPNVVVSIKPIHSIAAFIMKGVGEPNLLIDASGSPHNFSMKPTQAKALQNADLVVWVSDDLELFLRKALPSVAANAAKLELIKADGMKLLEMGEHGHDHDEHEDHAKHDGHDDHAKHDDNDHEAHEDGGDVHGETHDPHIWLNPKNAKIIAAAISRTLSRLDEKNTAIYQKNLAAFEVQLGKTILESKRLLGGSISSSIIVFHDAYDYYRDYFGLNVVGSLTINPDVSAGAEKLRAIRSNIKSLNVKCMFSEPQFEPRVVSSISQGLDVEISEIDPLGSAIDAGKDQYFLMLTAMAKTIGSCLNK